MEDRSDPAKQNLRALILAAMLSAATIVALGSCGDGDLGFPGSLPPTSTAAATATATPDDN
jgi:hypothetical protein